MCNKLSFEDIRQDFINNSCELLENEYKNNKALMSYKCSCGNISKIRYSDFKNGVRCNKCAVLKKAEKLRSDYGDVKQYFDNQNCILLSETYINSHTLLDYICECGNISKITFANFKYGYRCQKCGGNEKYNYEQVSKYFDDNECKLTSKEYHRVHDKLEYICKCGRPSTISFHNFKKGNRCRKCADENNSKRLSGENHPNWNPDRDYIETREKYQIYVHLLLNMF